MNATNTNLTTGEDEIDVAELRGEYLGSYGRYGGTLVHEVYAVPTHAAEIKRLWAKLDTVDDVTEEGRIFDRLKKLGALVSE